MQVILTLVVSVAFLFIWNFQAFWSGIVAGAVCVLANLVLIFQVLRFRYAQSARRFLAALWLGEAAKLVILGVLTVIAIKYLGIIFLPYLISLIVNLFVFWVAPLFLYKA